MAYTLLSAGTASRNSSISYSESNEAGSAVFPLFVGVVFAWGCTTGLEAAFDCEAFAAFFLFSLPSGIFDRNFATVADTSWLYTSPLDLAASISLIISKACSKRSIVSSVTVTLFDRIASSKSSTAWVKPDNSLISTVAEPPFKVWAARKISSIASLLVGSCSITRMLLSNCSTCCSASLKKSFNNSSLLISR